MDLQRFADVVRQRREELGLTQNEVTDRGGPTNTTLGKIENGEWKPGNKATMRKLDVALDWAPGSSAAVLAGKEPTLSFFTSNKERARHLSEQLQHAELESKKTGAATATGTADGYIASSPGNLAPLFDAARMALDKAQLKVGDDLPGAIGDLSAAVTMVTVILDWLGDAERSRSLSTALASSGGWTIGTGDNRVTVESKMRSAQIALGIKPSPETQQQPITEQENDDVLETATQQDAPSEAGEVEKSGGSPLDQIAQAGPQIHKGKTPSHDEEGSRQ